MFAWITKLFKLVLSSKFTALLGLVAGFIGLLSKPEFSGLVPADWSAWLASVGVVIAALSRGLVDANGNGIPDILEHVFGGGSGGHARLLLLITLTAAGVGTTAILLLSGAR